MLPVIFLLLLQSFCSLGSELETIRKRVVAELMTTTISEERVNDILQRMDADGSFPEIDYQDLSRTAGFPHRRHTAELVYLAKAYAIPSSPYYQDPELKKKITISLEYWVNNDFVGDNWHNNQITTPTNLVNLMLLIGDKLPENLVQKAQPIIGRAHMEASGARPVVTGLSSPAFWPKTCYLPRIRKPLTRLSPSLPMKLNLLPVKGECSTITAFTTEKTG